MKSFAEWQRKIIKALNERITCNMADGNTRSLFWHIEHGCHIRDADDEAIALVRISNPQTPEQHEHARLIAAAPDIYEALKAVEYISQDGWVTPYCFPCGGWEEQGHTDDCKVGNALKKAEGE